MGVRIGVHYIAPCFVVQLALSCFRILEGTVVFSVSRRNRGFRIRNESRGRGARWQPDTDMLLDHVIVI